MPNAAPVLGLYEKMLGNVNPIAAFAQGAQLRTRLDAIAAEQAAQSFQTTLDFMRLADERSIANQKMALASRELDIDAMNAVTNRMNAERALSGRSSTAKAATPGPPQPFFGIDEDGNMFMTFGAPQPTDPGSTPPDDTVTPLDQAAPPSPSLPSEPDARPSGPPSPPRPRMTQEMVDEWLRNRVAPAERRYSEALASGNADEISKSVEDLSHARKILEDRRREMKEWTDPSPGVITPSLSGDPTMAPPSPERTRAAGAGPRTAPAGAGRMYITGGSYNAKTGSNSFQWSTAPPKKPGAPPTNESLENMKNFASTWGLKPDKMEFDENGVPKITFSQESANKSDFSVSALSAESQKIALPIMQELATLAEGVRAATPTDAQKMAEVGVTNPDLMTPELWNEGHARAMQKGIVDPAAMANFRLKAREFAAFMNLQFAGKSGYVPSTEATVISSLGIRPIVPAKRAAKEPKPANPADIAKYKDEIIPALQKRINEAAEKKDLPALQQAQAEMTSAREFLAQLEAQGKEAGAPTAPTAPATPMAAEMQRSQQQAATRKQGALSQGKAQEAASNIKWNDAKTKLLKAINDSGADLDSVDRSGPIATPSIARWTLENGVYPGMNDWFKKNKEALEKVLPALDGGELTLKSPVFVDASGKKVLLKDVYWALLEDPARRANATTTTTAPGGRPLTISVGAPKKVE